MEKLKGAIGGAAVTLAVLGGAFGIVLAANAAQGDDPAPTPEPTVTVEAEPTPTATPAPVVTPTSEPVVETPAPVVEEPVVEQPAPEVTEPPVVQPPASGDSGPAAPPAWDPSAPGQSPDNVAGPSGP